MLTYLKTLFVFFFFLLLMVCFSAVKVEAKQFLIITNVGIEDYQKSMKSKSIDDLLGPDINFPFDPANHRDSSNPIKRIGKIREDFL